VFSRGEKKGDLLNVFELNSNLPYIVKEDYKNYNDDENKILNIV
jgi:hypothetical protein